MTRTEHIAKIRNQIASGAFTAAWRAAVGGDADRYERMTDAEYSALQAERAANRGQLVASTIIPRRLRARG